MNRSYITMILENIRLSHTERLLHEAQTDLELIRGQRLINESVMAIQNELSYLLQENMDDQQQGGIGSHIRNNWGKYATGGAVAGMAHAGAFGSNAKHLVDNTGNAIKEGGGRIFDHTTNAMNDTAKFYEKDIGKEAAGSINAGSNGHIGSGSLVGHAGISGGNHFNDPKFHGMDSEGLHNASRDLRQMERDHVTNHLDQSGGFGSQIGNTVDNAVEDTGDFLTDHAVGLAGLAGAGVLASKAAPAFKLGLQHPNAKLRNPGILNSMANRAGKFYSPKP